MSNVIVKENESLDSALRRFKRNCAKAGIQQEIRKSRGTPFPPPSSRGGILSLHGLERIPGVPVASQEEALSTGKASGTPGSCNHSQSPPDVSVHSRETFFPTLPRLSGRGSTHTTVARGTALWESLEGKPQIP